jgi:hypothetical protein
MQNKEYSRAALLRCTSFILLILTVAIQGRADLIKDGGFESPTVGRGGADSGYYDFDVGNTIGGVWIVVGNDGGDVAVYPNSELLDGYIQYNVAEGTQALDLTGDIDEGAVIGVQQTVATIPGTKYVLTFYVGSTEGQNALVNVLVNGAKVFAASNSNETIRATNWESFSFDFTANGTLTSLAFYNGSPGGVQTNGRTRRRVRRQESSITGKP